MDNEQINLSAVKLAIVDTETTGLDPATDEVIGMSIFCVEVDRVTGRLMRILDRYDALREPQVKMSALAEEITGIQYSQLVGEQLDDERILDMLAGCELVVSHCAAFDRQFLEPCLPAFELLPWACSYTEIDWLGAERQPSASLVYLLSLHGIDQTSYERQTDCSALASLLDMPLPVSGHTGFAALLDAVRSVQIRYTVLEADAEVAELVKEKKFQHFPEQNLWQITLQKDEVSELESWLVDSAVDGEIGSFTCDQIDAFSRFSGR